MVGSVSIHLAIPDRHEYVEVDWELEPIGYHIPTWVGDTIFRLIEEGAVPFSFAVLWNDKREIRTLDAHDLEEQDYSLNFDDLWENAE